VAAAEAAGVASASAPSRSAPQATTRKIANRSAPATAAGLTGVDQTRLVLGVAEASSRRDTRGLAGGAVAPQRFRSSHPDLVRCVVSQEGVDPSNGLSPIDIENSTSVMRASLRVDARVASVQLASLQSWRIDVGTTHCRDCCVGRLAKPLEDKLAPETAISNSFDNRSSTVRHGLAQWVLAHRGRGASQDVL